MTNALTGRPATAEERRSFGRYLELILLWNRAQRLTGVQSPAEIVQGLFEDSLLFLARIPGGAVRIVDIGAGAGIPGIPMRIVRPEIALTLIESKRKRVSFLRSLKRELGLGDVTILEGRAEDLVRRQADLAGMFDIAVSRAVGPVQTLLPVAMQYLRSGGVFLASGPPPGFSSGRIPRGVEVHTVGFAELGVARTFLSATKGDVLK